MVWWVEGSYIHATIQVTSTENIGLDLQEVKFRIFLGTDISEIILMQQ